MTLVTLQVVKKSNTDVCVVNATDNSPANSYCRILHAAMYNGETISDDSLPTSSILQLEARLNSLVPSLVSQGITCESFFAIDGIKDLKALYTDFTFFTVTISLNGCIEESNNISDL